MGYCAAFKRPPFRIEEEGWGEFDMEIVLTAAEKGGEHSLPHDLNFQSERYEAKHNVVSLGGVLGWAGFTPASDPFADGSLLRC